MLSPKQIKCVKTLLGKSGISDADYRTILRSVGHVESCKDLNNRTFVDVMAMIELRGGTGTFWQNRSQASGTKRQVYLVRQLAQNSRYELPAMCSRMSGGRTDQVEQLTGKELWNLIEMFKSEAGRESRRASTKVRPLTESLFPAAPTTAPVRVPAKPAAVPIAIKEDHDDIPF